MSDWWACGHSTVSESCYTCLRAERDAALLQVSELKAQVDREHECAEELKEGLCKQYAESAKELDALDTKYNVEKARADACADNAAHWQKDCEDANRQNEAMRKALSRCVSRLHNQGGGISEITHDCNMEVAKEAESVLGTFEKRDDQAPFFIGIVKCPKCHASGLLNTNGVVENGDFYTRAKECEVCKERKS